MYARGANYSELFGELHFRDLVTARVGVAYDAYGSSDSIADYELQARFPLAGPHWPRIWGRRHQEPCCCLCLFRDLELRVP